MQVRRQAVALVGAFCLLPLAAHAEAPAEAFLNNWVASLDASPDWSATSRGVTFDSATDTATLSGLTVRSEPLGVEVDVETIAVTGYNELPDNGYEAASLSLDGGSVKAGFGTVAISDVLFENLTVPQLPALVIDKEKPFTSMMQAYSALLKTSLGKMHIGSLEVIEQIHGQTSRISYADLEMSGLAGGKIASMTSGPMKMESPNPQGIVTFNIGGLESRDMDLGAIVHVYSPDAYVGGVGDMKWMNGLAFVVYKDISIEAPGARITFGSWSMENFRLRQPRQSFAEFLDIVMTHPDMPEEAMNKIAASHVIDMFSAFGLGRIALNDMQVQADGLDRLTLGDFHMNDMSIEGIGEIGIADLDVAVANQGAVKIGRFAFGGIGFPKYEVLKPAIDWSVAHSNSTPYDSGGSSSQLSRESEPYPGNSQELVPTLGFVDVAGLDLQTPEAPRVTLDSFRVDLSDHIGPVPTTVVAELNGLTIPVSSISDPQARDVFKRFGYDVIDASYGLKLHWTEATETVSVDDVHFNLAGIGSFAANFALAGLGREQIENPEILGEAIDNLSLKAATMTFRDESIVGKSLDLLAEKMKAKPDKFRQQFADAMPFLLSLVTISEPGIGAAITKSGLLAKLSPAVKTFVATPGASITLTLSPPKPVPLPELSQAAETAPDSLIGLLGLSVSAEAGTGLPPDDGADPTLPKTVQ